MKKISINRALGLLALGFLTGGAQANWGPAHLSHGHAFESRGHAFEQSRAWVKETDRRLEQQAARIHRGLHGGELTRREAHRLTQQQHDIRALQRRFLADGRLSAHEFHQLDRALDAAHRSIVAESRDRQVRPSVSAHRHY